MDKRVHSTLAIPKWEPPVSLVRIWIDFKKKRRMYWVFIKSGAIKCCAESLVPSSLLSATYDTSGKWFSSSSPVWHILSIFPVVIWVTLCCVESCLLFPSLLLSLHTSRDKNIKITLRLHFHLDEMKSVKRIPQINIYTKARHYHNSESRNQGTRDRHAKA